MLKKISLLIVLMLITTPAIAREGSDFAVKSETEQTLSGTRLKFSDGSTYVINSEGEPGDVRALKNGIPQWVKPILKPITIRQDFKTKQIFPGDDQVVIIEFCSTDPKKTFGQKCKAAFKWTVKKSRQGIIFLNPYLQGAANGCQIALPWII